MLVLEVEDPDPFTFARLLKKEGFSRSISRKDGSRGSRLGKGGRSGPGLVWSDTLPGFAGSEKFIFVK